MMRNILTISLFAALLQAPSISQLRAENHTNWQIITEDDLMGDGTNIKIIGQTSKFSGSSEGAIIQWECRNGKPEVSVLWPMAVKSFFEGKSGIHYVKVERKIDDGEIEIYVWIQSDNRRLTLGMNKDFQSYAEDDVGVWVVALSLLQYVWSGSTYGYFISRGENQFIIRAESAGGQKMASAFSLQGFRKKWKELDARCK